jgi:hypothetical protein
MHPNNIGKHMQTTYKILRTVEEVYSTSGELVSTRSFQPLTPLKVILEAIGETFTTSGHNLKYRRVLWLTKHEGLPLHLAIAKAYKEKSNAE